MYNWAWLVTIYTYVHQVNVHAQNHTLKYNILECKVQEQGVLFFLQQTISAFKTTTLHYSNILAYNVQ